MLYLCRNCGRIRRHGRWIYPKEDDYQEIANARGRVVWIKRDRCLACYEGELSQGD